MIHPKCWLKHWKARRALVGYTLYDTPHKRVEHALSQRQKQDNFDYFIRVRLSRLKFFQAWLHDNFKINASLDGSGIVAINAWIGSYGGGLIGDEPHTMRIFETYHPLWVGEYAGYNVMVDIAIFPRRVPDSPSATTALGNAPKTS
jgi:hypothetical protein